VSVSLPYVGIGFWRHFPEQDQNGKSLAKAVLAFQEQFGFDLVKITPASTWQVQDFGFASHWNGNPTGKREILDGSIQFLHKLKGRNPSNFFLEQARIAVLEVKEGLKETKPVLQTLFSPSTQLVQLVGVEGLKELAASNPVLLCSSLDYLLESTCYQMDCLADSDALFYAIGQAGPIDQALGSFQEMFEAFDAVPLQDRAGKQTVVHLHGENLPSFLLDALPEYCLIHYEQNPDIVVKPNHWPGLSLKQLHAPEQEKLRPFLTAGCVLPMHFPTNIIQQWKAKYSL
jgi:uroporphyrinogen decarboxylase